ncbi:MAG: CapA family protein [Spirochaetes bacterium]|nr:CapA family protein [Spirochaetota bacterium]
MRFAIFTFLCVLLITGCSSTAGKKIAEPEEIKTKKLHPRPLDEVCVLFAGDVMLDWGISDTMEKMGVSYPLLHLKDFLRSFDYRFCNLECPIAKEGDIHPDKKYVFLGKPVHIELLKYAGIDGVSLANNHACDYGKSALLYTVKNLISSGISISGAGENRSEAHLPVVVEKNDVNIAIMAYTAIAYDYSFAGENSPGVARARIDLIAKDIAQFKEYYDYFVVSVHWGDEYSDYPNSRQIQLAHQIIDSGADVIVGHHPHIFQGVEIYRNKPIFYSIGNFIFGSVNEDIKNNILVSVTFSKKDIKEFRIFPINGNTATSPFQYSLLKGREADDSLKDLLYLSKPLGSKFIRKSKIRESSIIYSFNQKK